MNPRDPALNYVVVAGVQSPGRADISGASRPYEWEIQQGYGLGGARTIYKGPGIAKPTLTVALWEPEHFVAWDAFEALLKPPTSTKPFAIGMAHPKLSAAKIAAVQVEDVGVPERQDNGIWLVIVKLVEYRPPLPALVTPRGSVPAGEKGTPVTPKSAEDHVLDQITEDIAKQKARSDAAAAKAFGS